MRYLGIARLRLLTTTRTWTPIYVLAILPPAFAALAAAVSEGEFRHDPAFLLPTNAASAMLAWVLHAILLGSATELSGRVNRSREATLNARIPDLLDTAPIRRSARFWGDVLGTFAATALIHICCLPLLAAVAAVSPLPLTLFFWLEVATLAFLILTSAGASWQRSAAPTKSGVARMAITFSAILLLLVIVWMTTSVRAFRDALMNFILVRPSAGGWAEVLAAIDEPALFVVLVALLYGGTLLYYHVNSTSRRAWEN